MFKFTKISLEALALLLLSGFVFLYVILTRYFALALLLTAIIVTYRIAKNHHIYNRAVRIYKQEYNKTLPLPPDQPSCVKVLPNPPDTEIWLPLSRLLNPPSNKNIEQQVEKFRQELNQD